MNRKVLFVSLAHVSH